MNNKRDRLDYLFHPEQFCFETFKLKLLITFNKNIPKEYKKSLKERLIHYKPIKSFENSKDLFSHLIYFHSYDLFTSAILCISYGNARSFELIMRALLENYFITEYIEKHPNQISNIFTKEKNFWEAKKWNKTNDKRLFNIYNRFLSKQAHPTPTRLLSGIDFMSFLKPKKDFNLEKFLSLSPKERRDSFYNFFEKDVSPSPGLYFNPHKDIRNNNRKISDLIYLFDLIQTNLSQVESLCPIQKINSESWKEILKKYGKN